MTLEVGVLGYRFMGKAHANAMARLPMFFPDAPEIERRVLVGRDESALSDAAERLGFDSISTDWRDVVDQVDVFYNLGRTTSIANRRSPPSRPARRSSARNRSRRRSRTRT